MHNNKDYCKTTKTITSIFACVRIEKEGVIIKNTLVAPNIEHLIGIFEYTYEYDEKNTIKETNFEINNKQGNKFFSCFLYEIFRIEDKAIDEGKTTIFINKNKINFKIMIYNNH